jgi:hypothetical protein
LKIETFPVADPTRIVLELEPMKTTGSRTFDSGETEQIVLEVIFWVVMSYQSIPSQRLVVTRIRDVADKAEFPL